MLLVDEAYFEVVGHFVQHRDRRKELAASQLHASCTDLYEHFTGLCARAEDDVADLQQRREFS